MDGETAQVSSFPLPPPYADTYSNERVTSGLVAQPPPPINGPYSTFGEPANTFEPILPSLESTGVRCLYTSGADPRQELKKLTRSLVAAFLDLIEILIRCPDSKERLSKMDDLRILFINTHHLINEYRPHQARETLHLLLQVQLGERRNTIQKFKQQFSAVAEGLSDCLNDTPDDLALSPSLLADIENVLNEKQCVASVHDDVTGNKDDIMCDLVDEK